MPQKNEEKIARDLKADNHLIRLRENGFRIWEYTIRGKLLTAYLIDQNGVQSKTVINLS